MRLYRREKLLTTLKLLCHIITIVIQAVIMHAHSVVVLNQRRWQSLGGQHGNGVDGLFEKMSFQTAFKGVESG